MKPKGKSQLQMLGDYFHEHQLVVDQSLAELCQPLMAVGELLVEALEAGHKVLAFGNGGSATQASHFAGELVGRFAKNRKPLPAVALSSDPGIVTCIGNDFGYGALFERQVEALAQPGDVAFGFTTSGKSENVQRGLAMARQKQAITVALTGSAGLSQGKPDHLLDVPSTSTAWIQEVHLMFLHAWCIYVEQAFEQK